MTPAPLLISRDPDLLDDVARLAAVAGAEPVVARSPGEARRWWSSASLVLVGADVLPETVPAGLPRRSGVVVVTRDEPAAPVWHAALDVGADEVVQLPVDDSVLVGRLVAGPGSDASRALVVGVVGGSGGAGASVLAVSLALAAVRLGRETVLVDLDAQGGGLDLALGAEDVEGARWSDLAGVTGLVAADTLMAALPHAHRVSVLAPARELAAPRMPTEAVPAVLDSVVAASAVVVLDIPRSDDEVRAAALARADVLLLVVTPDVRGSAAAQAVCASVRERCDVRAVVRTQPASGLDAQAVADWLAVPLAAELAHDPRLTAALDRGDPPGLSARSRTGRVAQALLLDLLDAR